MVQPFVNFAGPSCNAATGRWLNSVTPSDVTLQQIFASVWPFICLQIVGLALVIIYPDIALFLPKFMAK